MGSLRRVRQLTIRAGSASVARRSAIHLEDALRTATLPGADASRVVVIRSLSLGRIRADASPAQLALTLEQRVWELEASAVHALDPGAPAARAVYFRDAGEAHLLLARCIARGDQTGAWFWRSAVPAWTPGSSPASAIRDIIDSAACQDAAPLVTVSIVRTVADTGAGDLLAAVTGRDASRWIGAYGWRTFPAPVAPAAPPAVPVPLLEMLARWVPRWGGAADARARWLAALAIIAARPQSSGDVSLAAQADALARAVEHRPPIECPTPATRARDAVRQGATDIPIARGAAPAGRDHPVALLDGGRLGERLTRRENASLDAMRRPAPAPGPLDQWEHTRGGGLLFLLNVMTRLGFGDWLDRGGGPPDLALHVLAAIATRLRIADADPLWHLLESRQPLPPGRASAATAWAQALRRRLRRARLDLRAVAVRDAQLWQTGTHADVRFALQQGDIRLRRAGLDIDPGWVPWFGRVVRFHYGGRVDA